MMVLDMKILEKLDEKYGNSSLWQFVKFNLAGYSISFVQLVLANLLPFVFNGFDQKLPVFLRSFFDPSVLFDKQSRYVADGVVTWAYVLPFFFSNLIANIYGYFINRKTVFKKKGNKRGIVLYFIVLITLILVSTWIQGRITAFFMKGSLAFLARTIAASAAGIFQVLVLFPLEKYVIFKE